MINFKLIKIYPIGFILILLVSAILGTLNFGKFYFLRNAFNILEESAASDYNHFIFLMLIYFLTHIISLIVSIIFPIIIHIWVLRSIQSIASQILAQLIECKSNYFNQIHREGKIFSTIFNDLTAYVLNKVKLISFYFLNIGMFISSSGFLIYNNWKFGLAVVLSFLLVQLTPKKFKRRLEKINKNQSRANKYYIAKFSEALDNHFPLRLFGSAKLLKKHMFDASKNEIISRYHSNRFSTFVGNFATIIFMSLQSVIMLTAIVLYSLGYFKGSLKLGDVISLPNILSSLLNGLGYLIGAKLQQETANNYLNIIKKQIAQIQENKETKKSEMSHFSTLLPSITIKNLRFSYENKEVFKNLKLKFAAGLIYGIEGASGIGKSTLISLILGKHDSYQGSIKIGENEVRELGENNIYDWVKLVDASNFVFDATIEENVTLFNSSLNPLPAINKAALLEEYESLAQQKVEAPNLSEGQKQRVNLARLFQHIDNAKILIFDEALSNLDKESREKVKKSFSQLKTQGYTLIFISHHIDKSDTFYDQLINLEEEVKKTKK